MTQLERIVAHLGGVLLDGGRRALVPGPGHGASDRSVSLALTGDGRLLIHCFSPKDDWRSVRDHLRARGLLDEPPQGVRAAPAYDRSLIVQPLTEDRRARARAIWAAGETLDGSVARRYLHARGVGAATENTALRFHPRASSLDDRRRRPALLAAISGADGALQGVQITLLSSHGAAKAAVATPRRVVGLLKGGAVRLSPCGPALAIAEGVESALSAAQALHVGAWAALSALNLAHFDPPAPVRRLLIAADNDAPGLEAAEALRRRLAYARPEIDVAIHAPPSPFGDWNDWARDARA